MSTLHDFLTHPIESLEKALHIRKQIDQLQKQLSSLFGAHPPAIAGLQLLSPRRKGSRKMSAEARARIAAAQKARWAKQKGSEAPETPVHAVKAKKGGMSAEGRARIAAAQKVRWAKVKAGQPAAATAAAPKKKKRKISAAHRAKLAASAKARWARLKMGKK